MSYELVIAVQRQLEAYNNGDLDGFLAQYSPEVVQMSGASADVLVQGMEAFRSHYEVRFTSMPPRCTLLSRTVIGDWVVDHEHVAATGGAPPRAAGAAFHVTDGLIDRVIALS